MTNTDKNKQLNDKNIAKMQEVIDNIETLIINVESMKKDKK